MFSCHWRQVEKKNLKISFLTKKTSLFNIKFEKIIAKADNITEISLTNQNIQNLFYFQIPISDFVEPLFFSSSNFINPQLMYDSKLTGSLFF